MADETIGTRARILDACLRLFNETGPVAVTTAEIARTVGINEGNLYYYFKKKEDILVALFEQFETALNEVANTPPDDTGNSDVPGLSYLKRWFNLMWEWRFFYRDGATIKRLAPNLRVKNIALADRGQADIKRVLEGMVAEGILQVENDDLDKLVVNAWIIASYWLDYLCSRHGVDHVTHEHIDWGFAQVLNLFAPYSTVNR